MKIGALSDIHADINTRRRDSGFTGQLIDYFNSLHLDVFLIPGDAAGSLKGLIDFFDSCRRLDIPHKIYIPGNHDIWTGKKIPDGSWIKYRTALPGVCGEFGWTYLPGNPGVIGNTAFFGSMGWYDYSTANRKWDRLFGEEEYGKKINPDNARWMDGEYARFGMSDRETAEVLLGEAENDLEKLGFSIDRGEGKIVLKNPRIKTIVFLSHMVPYIDFIHFRDNPSWDFFGAYIGNINIGRLLDRLPPELRRIVFFGHTHFPGEKVLESGVEGYCVPLGYPEEYGKGDLAGIIGKRIKVIDV